MSVAEQPSSKHTKHEVMAAGGSLVQKPEIQHAVSTVVVTLSIVRLLA